MRWLDEQSSLNRRLKDHLTLTTMPRVASELGPGWKAEGLRLKGPQGEDFRFDLSGFCDSPALVIYPARRLAKDDEDPDSVSVAPTARPETIARELRAELLPVCAELLPDPAPSSDPGNGRCATQIVPEFPSTR